MGKLADMFERPDGGFLLDDGADWPFLRSLKKGRDRKDRRPVPAGKEEDAEVHERKRETSD